MSDPPNGKKTKAEALKRAPHEKPPFTIGDLKKAIPAHCFQKSLVTSFRYLIQDLLMAYAHVAHDCIIGNNVILANATTLGGHVRIDDFAILGGIVAIHQFIRIGTYAFIGGKSGLRMDMPPYMLAFGAPGKLYGPNLVGLRRHGFPRNTIQALKSSYRIMFRSGLTLTEAIDRIREEVEATPEVDNLIQFMQDRSKRGVTRR